MCVILAVGKDAQHVKQDEWFDAFVTNSDGYGVAWIDDGIVKFVKKTFKTKNDIKKWDEWRPPKPYIMHFRLATVGAEMPELCHPYIVAGGSRLAREGRAKKVLFHNGHWSGWNNWLGITYSGRGKLPSGEYSDSRVMALMLHYYGDKIFDIADITPYNRIATLEASGAITLYGSGWDEDKSDGIIRSNRNHQWSYAYYTSSEMSDESWQDCIECGKSTYVQGNDLPMCFRCEKALKEFNKSTRSYKEINCPICGIGHTGGVTAGICIDCHAAGANVNCVKCNMAMHMSDSQFAGVCITCADKLPDSTKRRVLRDKEAFIKISTHLERYEKDGMFVVPTAFTLMDSMDSKKEKSFWAMARAKDGRISYFNGDISYSGDVSSVRMDDDDADKEMEEILIEQLRQQAKTAKFRYGNKDKE